MALAPTHSPAVAAGTEAPADLRWFVFILFFIFGGITSLNDILIPKLKGLFELSHTESMLIQFAFFTAYLVVSVPAAMLVKRFGYMRSATIGLIAMTVGCLLFIPASLSGLFVGFLLALFVLAAGITTVQVVANPLISMLGRPETAHSRLTFAQAFNSLGTTVFPFVGARLILDNLAEPSGEAANGAALVAFRAAETQTIVYTYLGLAAALLIVALAVWTRRDRLVPVEYERANFFRAFNLLARPRFALGALGIFLYVGAEVAIGSLLVSYLVQSDILAIGERQAGELVAFYWGGAMVGRFIGAALLRRFTPSMVLAAVAIGASMLLVISSLSTGSVAGWSLLLVGLMNSIMFPTIFSLACEGLGDRTPDGSGLLCVAIVGGAVVPLLVGAVADQASIAAALLIPVACYLGILTFAAYCRRHPVLATG